MGRAALSHPVAGVLLVDDRGGIPELVPLVVREQPGLVQVGVVQTGQLLDVPADVDAAGVVTTRGLMIPEGARLSPLSS